MPTIMKHNLITPVDHYIPKHIAVYNHSSLMSNSDIAFQVEAVNIQLRDHVAPLWDGEPPGISFVGKAMELSSEQAAILGYVDDDGNAESAGYHTDLAGRVYGLVDVGQSRDPSGTLSHEACEMYGNARLVRKVAGPKNRFYYVELNDPCQRDFYEIEVTLFGEARRVVVSDFVLPAWFGMPNTNPNDPRTTFLNKWKVAPFSICPGGYQIAEELDGQIVFLSQGEFALNRSMHGRTNRIIKKQVFKPAPPQAEPVPVKPAPKGKGKSRG